MCLNGVNCATGYTHQVEIYVRHGNGWRKSFSVFATSVIWLSIDLNNDDNVYPQFRALVISVHGGDEVLNCPVRNKSDPTAWKHERCDFVVKWDGTKFIHKLLCTSKVVDMVEKKVRFRPKIFKCHRRNCEIVTCAIP